MTKKGVIRCVLAILLVIYISVAVTAANNNQRRQQCRGFDIRVEAADSAPSFVTADEVRRLLGEWHMADTKRPTSSINLQRIEDRLNSVVNIERATVERMPDNIIRIVVEPMVPVARVFDPSGRSYYINRQGKRLTANARYRLDVPVITGTFDSKHSPAALVPLIDYISSDEKWNAIVGQIMVEPGTRDVILVPMIRGHVINLGDTADIPGKLARVMTMYRKVMPLKGWEYYDTLSVKWGGQVVASRRVKSSPEPAIRFDQEGDVEEENIDAMLTTNTAVDTVSADVPNSPRPKDLSNQ